MIVTKYSQIHQESAILCMLEYMFNIHEAIDNKNHNSNSLIYKNKKQFYIIF